MKELLVADLFCGAGGSSTGARRALKKLGVGMKLLAVNHWPVAIETHSRNHPDARHYCVNLDAARPSELVPEGRLDLLMASPECFPAETTVLTSRGVVFIKDVVVGDLVLTHKGRWRRVTDVMSKVADTVRVRGEGHFGLETTAEHPFYVRRHKKAWNNAIRQYKTQHDEPTWETAGQLDRGAAWATPHTFDSLPLPDVGGRGFELSGALFYLAGLWIAEGTVRPDRGEITLSVGKHEGDDIEDFLSRFTPSGVGKSGANELRWRRRDIETATLFETAHKGLAQWLVEHFGRHAGGKTIPGWLLAAPVPWRRALLDGYCFGDGSVMNHRGQRVDICTVSRRLAVGIKLLAASLGYRPLMSHAKARVGQIDGRPIHGKPIFKVYWRPGQGKRTWALSDERHLWQNIKAETHPTGKKSKVYNLSVEDDESYVADGIVVHNCTYHSRARGGKPINDQSRMSAWHVIRWCTELRVRCVLVENVPEFMDWGPLDKRTGKPLKSQKGDYFRAWVGAMEAIGFKCEWKVLNAADYGDATTRQRFFLIARSDGEEIQWPKATHSQDGANGTKLWKPAREIIDWSLRGKSIFRRKRPLSEKTLSRIYVGAIKFGWPEPFLEAIRRYMTSLGYTVPVLAVRKGGKRAGSFVIANRMNNVGKDPSSDPIPGLTTAPGGGVYKVDPTLVVLRQNADMRDLGRPAPTICAGGEHLALATPLIVRSDMHKSNAHCSRTVDDPLATMTTGNGLSLVRPSLILPQNSTNRTRSVDEPAPVVTTTSRGIGFVTPVTHRDGSDRTRSTGEPLPTITCAKRGELAFIVPAFGERPTQVPRSHDLDSPAPTVCAKGRINLVQGKARPRRRRNQEVYEIDIEFRMLEPTELARAMGFNDEETSYEFVGNRTQVTKQVGNAVPVGLASALVGAMFAPVRKAKRRLLAAAGR